MLLEEGLVDEKGYFEEKLLLVLRKKAYFGSLDSVVVILNEERFDSGFLNFVMIEFFEEFIFENLFFNIIFLLED